MSVVLTVEIHAGTHEEAKQKIQAISDLVQEDFVSHDETVVDDGTVNFNLTGDLHPVIGTSETHPDQPRIQASERGFDEGEEIHRGADRVRT